MDFRNPIHSGLIAFCSVAGFLTLSVFCWIAAVEYRKQGDCHRVRKAVDQFIADKKVSPRSVEQLVRSGYLSGLPQDVPGLENCISTLEDSPLRGKTGDPLL